MGQNPYEFDVYSERRRAAAARDYTTPAIITLLLYWLFWLPGLIVNIVYWLQASKDQQITGQAPQGKGCLLALLIVFGALPAVLGIFVCGCYFLFLAALVGGSA